MTKCMNIRLLSPSQSLDPHHVLLHVYIVLCVLYCTVLMYMYTYIYTVYMYMYVCMYTLYMCIYMCVSVYGTR